jgi:colanic acid/amylovoran biosynthesis glycosyltransferase
VNIAYLVGSFPVPSQTFVASQILGVAARGHEVHIFTADFPSERWTKALDVRQLDNRIFSICPPRRLAVRVLQVSGLVVRCGWRAPLVVLRALNVFKHGRWAASLWLLYAALTLVRLGARRFDIIHGQFGTYGLLALKLAEVGAVEGALVTSFRGYDATKDLVAKRNKYRELFRAGRLFLPVSSSLARRLIDAGCDASVIQVLHSGVDCAKFRYRDAVYSGEEPLRLVTIGRLVDKKGVRYGVEAVAQVLASGRAVSYSVVGDGPLADELRSRIEALGIAGHVRLMGWKSHREILDIMAASHVLLAPSITADDGDEEGIPNVIKEAMAIGLPVISTWHAGIPELVTDGKSGFLVPERDASALAQRIIALHDCPEMWTELARAGRRKIEAEFEIGKLTEDLIGLYQLVSRGSATASPPSPATASAGAAAARSGPRDIAATRAATKARDT